ncbi:hypothetical protein BASA50_008453 [Batrachochytrium salamandrivorans]|uniref:Uncharacterized protein n=1 Tax=Batrachochytrium salamandrivorans TaxID=1357716 RepID=A0ABQ8F709_9FUNG|nr:hypothetical protein BASA50_008453 [Batrachochytrium salamandrivorans]
MKIASVILPSILMGLTAAIVVPEAQTADSFNEMGRELNQSTEPALPNGSDIPMRPLALERVESSARNDLDDESIEGLLKSFDSSGPSESRRTTLKVPVPITAETFNLKLTKWDRQDSGVQRLIVQGVDRVNGLLKAWDLMTAEYNEFMARFINALPCGNQVPKAECNAWDDIDDILGRGDGIDEDASLYASLLAMNKKIREANELTSKFIVTVNGTIYLMPARIDALWTARKVIQIGILVDTHPFSADHCILCDQQLLSTSIAHLVVECEQVVGHRIQSGLVPAIQKSRLRLLGRALDPGVENVYTWLRGGVLNGETDLDQRWLDGSVEHESMGTRHDNRAAGSTVS